MANIHSNISFALVNIPVVMNPVIKNNDTSFNQLHKKCLHRINYQKYCPHCKKIVKDENKRRTSHRKRRKKPKQRQGQTSNK